MRPPPPSGPVAIQACAAGQPPSRLTRRPHRGQGLVEYALILVLIAVVVLVILKALTQK